MNITYKSQLKFDASVCKEKVVKEISKYYQYKIKKSGPGSVIEKHASVRGIEYSVWRSTDSFPHQGLNWTTDVGIKIEKNNGIVSIVVGRERIPGKEVNPGKVEIKPPKVARDVYLAINNSSHHRIDTMEDLDSFLRLAKIGFDVPRYVVSVDQFKEMPIIDVEELFKGVAGSGEIVIIDRTIGRKMEGRGIELGIKDFAIKNLTCFNGALRIIKEEIPADIARPYQNILFFPDRIREDGFIDFLSEKACLNSSFRRGEVINIESVNAAIVSNDVAVAEGLIDEAAEIVSERDGLLLKCDQLEKKIDGCENEIARLEYELNELRLKKSTRNHDEFKAGDKPAMRFYRTKNGRYPALDFLYELSGSENEIAFRKLNDIPQTISNNDSAKYEKIGDVKRGERSYKVFEFRLDTKDHWNRLFFLKSEIENSILILSGISKTTNRLEKIDIESALNTAGNALSEGFK